MPLARGGTISTSCCRKSPTDFPLIFHLPTFPRSYADSRLVDLPPLCRHLDHQCDDQIGELRVPDSSPVPHRSRPVATRSCTSNMPAVEGPSLDEGAESARSKADLRRFARQRSRAHTPADWEAWNRSISTQALNWIQTQFHRPATITLFGGLPAEPDLTQLLLPQLIDLGHHPALFALNANRNMEARRVDSRDFLNRGPLQVWEPSPAKCPRIDPLNIDTVFVPGLFFSVKTGVRLGRGGGYYDRYLARLSAEAILIGVTIESQLEDPLPSEAHDIPVQWILTEKTIYRVPQIL